MYGRRYSDGIHQAIEAKEGLLVRSEDQTLATITFQNYFRLYEQARRHDGYGEDRGARVPRHLRARRRRDADELPVARKDNADIVYRTENAKFEAVVDEIIAEHEKGRPVLVGTRSIEKSERLAMLLRRRGVECNVLNAKYHEQEAQIIKDAGHVGRGDDRDQHGRPRRRHQARRGRRATIGGLHIIGTERHESRRIDNQLRGRAGRQGDPGSTRFYIALDDELMRLFGAERIQKMMDFVEVHRRDADRGGHPLAARSRTRSRRSRTTTTRFANRSSSTTT